MTDELVYLALEHLDFQGCNLHGVYTSQEAAEARLRELDVKHPLVFRFFLDEAADEWFGS